MSVERSAQGIRLDVDPVDLDSAWFEQELERAAAVSDPSRRLAVLDHALAAWRGDPYEEFAGSAFVEAETARLLERRDEAVERRIDALLSLGHHRQAIADIEAALVSAPYREELHAQLMLAMYRAGRQIEALRHLAAFRERLDDEVGVDCGPELRHLEDAILLQKPELDWVAPDGSPSTVTSVAPAPSDTVMGRRQLAEAIRSCTEALERDDRLGNPMEPTERCDLLIELGRLLRRAGDPRHREVLFAATDLAARLGDDDRRVRAVLANQNGVMASDLELGDAGRIERLCATLAVLGDEVSTRRARLLANLASELRPTAALEHRLRLSDEAVDLARATGDGRALAHVLRQRFYAIGGPDTLTLRRAAAEEYERLCGQLGDPAQADEAGWQLLQVAAEAGDLEAIDRAFAAFERSGRAWSGQPFYRWNLNVHRAWRRALAGRLDEALALVSETGALGRELGIGGADYIHRIQVATFRFESGDMGRIDPAPSDDAEPGCPPGRIGRILSLVAGGEHEHAARLLDLALEGRFVDVRGGLLELATYAEAASLLGHRPAASVLLEMLSPYEMHMAYAGVAMTCPVPHWLGCCLVVLDRLDEAEGRFDEALAVARQLKAPTMIARTTIERARLFARRGDRSRAEADLREATVLCRTWGFAGLLARATDELERLAATA